MAYAVPTTIHLKDAIIQGLQESSATALQTLGTIVEADDGRAFQYVYMDSSDVTFYCGRPMVWQDTTFDYMVNPDASDGVANAEEAAGGAAGFAGVATMNNIDVNNAYIWMQIRGLVDFALVSAGVAVNDELIVTSDNCFDDLQTYHTSITSVHWKVVGKALTAAVQGVVGVHCTASIMLY